MARVVVEGENYSVQACLEPHTTQNLKTFQELLTQFSQYEMGYFQAVTGIVKTAHIVAICTTVPAQI